MLFVLADGLIHQASSPINKTLALFSFSKAMVRKVFMIVNVSSVLVVYFPLSSANQGFAQRLYELVLFALKHCTAANEMAQLMAILVYNILVLSSVPAKAIILQRLA